MMYDAARAIRTLRTRAREWNLDPNRVGIMGFSAGGHLASTIATHFDDGNPGDDDPVERSGSRPDLAILCYPVISMMEPYGHRGSRENLLGKEPAASLLELLSNEKQVTPRTPPIFLFHTADDPGVPVQNSLSFAEACRRNNVPVELHVFESGRHGVGLALDHPVLKSWTDLLASWLRSRKFLLP